MIKYNVKKLYAEGKLLCNFNFNKETTREGTYSIQYEGTDPLFVRTRLALFWIADMHIIPPEGNTEAIQKRLDRVVCSYIIWKISKFYGPVKQWWKSRYDVDLTGDMITYARAVLYT